VFLPVGQTFLTIPIKPHVIYYTSRTQISNM
jgi:hypothetical protein